MGIASETEFSASADPRAAMRSIAIRTATLAGVSLHLGVILAFLWLTAHRVFHPLELGHVEGVLLDSARLLAEGAPLYPPPSFEFTPLAYMPGYFMVVAPLIKLFGVHLWVPRVVALVETLLLAGLLWNIVRRETGSAVLAVAAPALLFAAFGFCGGSYDLVQPNSQMLMFAFAGFILLRERTDLAGTVLAAACFAASFISKQHGLLFGLSALPWLWMHQRRRLLPFALALAVMAGGAYALCAMAFGPWFAFYTYDVPSHWSTLDRVKMEDLGRYVFGVFGIATTLGVIGALRMGRARDATPDATGRQLWWWCLAGGIGTGVLAALDPYSYRHTIMPMIAALALVAPIAAFQITAGFAARRSRTSSLPAVAVALWLIVPQYVPLLFSLHHYLAPPHGIETRALFYAHLHAIPGRAIIVNHGFYLHDAGKAMSAHLLPIEDVLRAHGNALLRRDPGYFDRMFGALMSGAGRPWLVTDIPLAGVGDQSNRYWRTIAKGYALVDSLGPESEAMLPPAGVHASPRYFYAPRDSSAGSGAAGGL